MRVIATWSGGKDSCFACFKAMQTGYKVKYLANTISHDFRRVRFHGIKAEFIQMQAKALGIPLLQKETHPDSYEREFKENLKPSLDNITGIVFGDIFLEDCFTWANRVASDLGIKAIEPLWKIESLKLLEEFIDSGFIAVVVSTQANLFDDSWVGRKIDNSFLKDINKLENIDPCGENGEYHSFVIDGPIFKKRIKILKSQKILIDGYWFLDIQTCKLTSKNT